MTPQWNYRTDALYRCLPAESADLEWQCVEREFLANLQRFEPGKDMVTALLDRGASLMDCAYKSAKSRKRNS